jgi:small subunit ribosomal protein S4
MARFRGPRHKRSRRAGVDLFGTGGPSLERRLHVPPGGQKNNPRRRQSDYAIQLRAKQRVKESYGLQERQFRRFFQEARRLPGPTGENLLRLLEQRLDNVVYRLGYARTRAMARQLVSHRHVRVNGQKVNVPSYLVKPGDEVELAEKAAAMAHVQEELESRTAVPRWLARDGMKARVQSLPERSDIEPDLNEGLVVEFYAR